MLATKQWERVGRFMPRLGELIDVLPDDLHGRVVREQMRKTEAALHGGVERARRGAAFNAEARAGFAAAIAECAHLLRLTLSAGLVHSERAEEVEREARELAGAVQAARKRPRRSAA